ncbi:MAG: Membrane protein insertase, YidC/Oxa1 family [Parcubacteria group bacterium GW2011_GWB1_57_6]|nr:MAG: Membrane protein insertase, YidC/Oxa1 family [Parcubacteria group bacterium GW2011_GWA1_56_13]KKW46996.1 MAG: Membrane protein insertase, YidC/Oxa1 family [Parcubacteria group bacterium GW2011_GWB1_57_6]
MISTFFHAVFYDPIYNALVALVALVPGSDVGIAVVLVTIIIRLILLPFSLSAARTQRAMKVLEPKLKELKEKHKGNKEKEALETLGLYREARVNPFASILMVFIQIPVLLALYWVFYYEPLSTINVAQLYSFTPVPHAVSLQFLGLISVAGKSLVLAVLAGLTQFFQAHMALSGTMKPSDAKGIQNDFQRVMGMQLKYVFPFIIGVISYTTSGAIALYFITTNLAGALQEWHVQRVIARETSERVAP